MAGFSSVRDYVDSIEEGQVEVASWRKAPNPTTTAGVWYDLSMHPGNPAAQYYASSPLESRVLDGAKGIRHGGAVTPETKHLKEFMVLVNASGGIPLTLRLLDYLLYYPFVDMGTNDEQTMTVVDTLPRYTDGDGVQIIAVQVGSQATGGATFNVSYTNQDGVAGRLTPTVTCNNSLSVSGLIQSERTGEGRWGPFLPLAHPDTGVRSIETFTMVSGTDVGLIALVLVKPIAQTQILEQTAPAELDYLRDMPSLPRIQDGAYLNLIAHQQASLGSTQFHGLITTVWS